MGGRLGVRRRRRKRNEGEKSERLGEKMRGRREQGRYLLPLTSFSELLHGCFHLVQLIPAITDWIVPNVSPHHLPQPTAPPPDHKDGAPEGITVTVLHSLEKLLAVFVDVCLCGTKQLISSYVIVR